MPGDDEESGHRPDRLWRVEQRQSEIIGRLDRIQTRIDENTQRREQHEWRVENLLAVLSKQMEELTKRPANVAGFFDPTIIKVVLGGLLSLVAALAFGKAFVFPG